jgi:glycosyltransferase involved in cell wall biosynthesis
VNGKLPISLVVITHNEEQNIGRCLAAADFCSEILVIDSGSTDETTSIATKFGAQVIHRDWTGYRDQKNFGSEQAGQPWILCIDADEVVSPELSDDIRRRFQTDPDMDAFEINRHSLYAGKLINHCGWYPQWRLFLYRKGKASWGGDEPHTVVVFHGNRKARLRGDLYHHTYANIRQHLAKNIASAHDAAVAMHQRGRSATLFDLLCRSSWSFIRTFVLKAGILDGFNGLVISWFSAFYTFTKYAMLHELNRETRHRDRSGGGASN